MKTPVTIESLLTRIRKEVAEKAKVSEVKKAAAKVERLRRAEPQPSMYAKEELWTPVALHREYEVQHCDCCKTEQTSFSNEKIELRHKIDRSAQRIVHVRAPINTIENGKVKVDATGWQHFAGPFIELPLQLHITERSIPECFACITAGKMLRHLFKVA